MVKNIVSPTPGSHLQPLAATRVVASGRQWPPSFSSHRQPLAPTCGQSSGRQWPPAFSSHRQPLAATCSQSSGRQWPPVSASSLFSAAATCSHLQPIEWPHVATSIWFFIGSHLPPLEWPPVAARILFLSATTYLQPLAATCSQSSGRKWPPEQVAASGRKWPPEQVAASGRLCQNQIRALLHALYIFICFTNVHCICIWNYLERWICNVGCLPFRHSKLSAVARRQPSRSRLKILLVRRRHTH